MKHQVLFCLSIFSFLSYASEHSRELADMYYAAQQFRTIRLMHGDRISPAAQEKLMNQHGQIASIPITAADKEAGMSLIYQAMKEDGSWNDLVQWGSLNNGPQKTREIR